MEQVGSWAPGMGAYNNFYDCEGGISMEIQKKKLGQLLVGEWNTKTIVAVAIGAALYGVLMVFGGIQIMGEAAGRANQKRPFVILHIDLYRDYGLSHR